MESTLLPSESDPADQSPPVVYLSPQDELANVITHGLGCLLSLACAGWFAAITAGQSVGLRVTCLLFTSAMFVVYLCSTLSHAVHEPRRRNRLRAWDQGTIYALIAGTYSPFIWEGTSGWLRGGMLVAVWGAAALGFYGKVMAAHRINAVSTVTYLALGWLPALPLIGNTPWICFAWMLAGGVSYSLGVLLLKQSSRRRYAHAAWHMMVMLGSTCHVVAIYQLLRQATANTTTILGN